MLVKNSALLDAFVGRCMDCDNMHSVSNIQFALTFLKVCIYLSLLTFLSLRGHALRILRIQFCIARLFGFVRREGTHYAFVLKTIQ
jgi:hypothetical protein